MIGVEIDMIISDSLKALELYEKIFDIERVEVTDLPQGENEAIFSLYGVRFHMLDANPEFGLVAPSADRPNTIWYNVMVPDIEETFNKAIELGCTEFQPITELPDYGITNATFFDPFGYQWMLHQVHRKVIFEERMELWEKRKNQ